MSGSRLSRMRQLQLVICMVNTAPSKMVNTLDNKGSMRDTGFRVFVFFFFWGGGQGLGFRLLLGEGSA